MWIGGVKIDTCEDDLTRGDGPEEAKVIPQVLYAYFEKPMSSRFLLPEPSTTSWNSQRSTLAQEGIRRLLNSNVALPAEERVKIMDDFASKCLTSGYSIRQTREIILSSLKGFGSKLKSDIPLHRNCAVALASSRCRNNSQRTDQKTTGGGSRS